VLTEIICYKEKMYWNIEMHNSEVCELHPARIIHEVIKSYRMESKGLVMSMVEETCAQSIGEEP
jgi:hypothetical protein